MNNPLASFLIILLVVGAASCANKFFIRCGNSMPQFGNAQVKAVLPFVNVFNSVPGGFLTSYANLTAKPWVFTVQYPSNITALSLPYNPDKDKFYSLFTYQTQTNLLLNKLIADRSTAFNATTPVIRTINLLQYNFPLDIYNLSNNVLIFSDVAYGEVTEYKPVPVGDYQLYWESAGTKKRSIQIGNVTGDPILFPGKAYSHWVLPTGSFIIQDGSFSTRKRSLSTRNLAVRRELKNEAKNENQREVLLKEEKESSTNSEVNLEENNKASISSR
eukprot:TRINITY_DN5077_c0_g1_i1.p1 TRINITY_DN5077_c0_g1~~TRINITY_DN5077_c0_g1_i1.p1  ORF type:complete len:274 (-),score=55.13 TRINITY_DN5077_c0_g1_i1:73-894(-)